MSVCGLATINALDGSRIVPVGSRITCNPPPMDTDEDFLVLVRPLAMGSLKNELEQKGWSLSGSEIADPNAKANNFFSYKKDEINLILTRTQNFFDRFLLATSVAKNLNLMVKEDRITLFQAILYGNRRIEMDGEWVTWPSDTTQI